MSYKNHQLGMDDWEMGSDRGMDFIDDPDIPIKASKKRKRINFTLIKKCGKKAYIQGVQTDTDYIVSPQGQALFIGDEIKERNLDPEVAKRQHTELPTEYLEIALREGDNRGHLVEDTEKAYQQRKAKRDAERAAEEATMTLQDRVMRTLDALPYEAEITWESPANTCTPTPMFWDLWKVHKDEIKKLGFQVFKDEDYDMWVVYTPKE